MSASTTRRGVSAAITTVLAVTLGAGALSVPATAAPLPTAVTAETGTKTAPVTYPVNGYFSAAGKTGFLTSARPVSRRAHTWTRFADGSTTTIGAAVVESTGSDVVVLGEGPSLRRSPVVKLRDMAVGGRTVSIGLGPLNGVYVKAVSKDTVLAEVTKADGSMELHLVTRTDDTITQRKIEGLPSGALGIASTSPHDGSVLVSYALRTETSQRHEFAVVDLAAAKVVFTHRTDARYTSGRSFSATHLVWAEDAGRVHTVDRATGVETVTDFGLYEGESMAVGLLGAWQMYGTPGTLEGDGRGDSRPLVPFTAKSLASGETVKLVDYVTSVEPGPDNTLFVRGGTVEHGDGLYRISLGADGRPAAELVASTGKPVQLLYLGAQIPHTFDLTSPIPLKWKLSRDNVDVDLKITHRGTGKSFTKRLYIYRESAGSPYLYSDGFIGITWKDIAAESQMGKDAEAGEYDWSFTAHPQNGVGPAVEASGSFTAAKGLSSPHDVNWNGTPDLLARDAQGVLWRADTTYDTTKKTLVASNYRPDRVGGGWQVYDRIETIGGIGTGSADFIARDKSGVLWLYDVTGNGYGASFAARKQIGGGWNTYTQITGGSDLNGDGRADLVATDKAGALWLYKNTGNLNAPFAKRQKIGNGGWGVYTQITATGNIGGAAAGDLVARDKNGVLWLYLGKGDGTFAARQKIGGGWNAYTDTIGTGDANNDGRPDLFAYGPGNTGYFYAGTGDYRKPFAVRVSSPVLTGDPAYNHVS
ncbi:FG-GAP repeat domain-containing protein [Streptomyces lancefieldiae]|uniref:FG-GAP-like repeat-containing protein n=1 Tax=Streptomyces lancefieldiae TaxID=3075520 RepID=A0ABU3AFV7_9ACTN|nr:FG-GAP-like repeat-containing protein [Streptomyces sp. DSM 40712]MDT0609056.1 FG-GAP-like repeat-containing protein [Streptomyces sp. DSM 40712]